MGSEMCIRDSPRLFSASASGIVSRIDAAAGYATKEWPRAPGSGCLLYTSDAADERSSVDLGGRRIIKKKNKTDRTRATQSNNQNTTETQS